jgi:hypothetical protein
MTCLLAKWLRIPWVLNLYHQSDPRVMYCQRINLAKKCPAEFLIVRIGLQGKYSLKLHKFYNYSYMFFARIIYIELCIYLSVSKNTPQTVRANNSRDIGFLLAMTFVCKERKCKSKMSNFMNRTAIYFYFVFSQMVSSFQVSQLKCCMQSIYNLSRSLLVYELPSHPPWFNHGNSVWWRKTIMNNFIVLFLPSSCYPSSSLMMEAVRTSETSVDNYFTRQYIPEGNSEHHTRRRENLKSHIFMLLPVIIFKYSPQQLVPNHSQSMCCL